MAYNHCKQHPDVLLKQIADALRRVYPNRSQTELDEARAEAVCRLYEKIHYSGQQPISPIAWTFTVAVNFIRTEHRRTERHVQPAPAGQSPIAEYLEADDRCDETASTEQIRALLRSLTPVVAETIWLHDVEGWKPSEIAERLGCTVNAVNLRIKRGRKQLHSLLRTEFNRTTYGHDPFRLSRES